MRNVCFLECTEECSCSTSKIQNAKNNKVRVRFPGNTHHKIALAKSVSQMHKWRSYRDPCRWHRDQKRTSESGYIISDASEKVWASKERPRENYLPLYPERVSRLFRNVVDLIFKILRKKTRKESLRWETEKISEKERLCSHLRTSSGVFILHDWWCVYVSTANVTRDWLPRFQIMQLCRQSAMSEWKSFTAKPANRC